MLKSTSGWNGNSSGTDSFEFSALPGGNRLTDGSFVNAGNGGFWWTATEYGGGYAYYRSMYYNIDNVYELNDDLGYAFSVRCLED